MRLRTSSLGQFLASVDEEYRNELGMARPVELLHERIEAISRAASLMQSNLAVSSTDHYAVVRKVIDLLQEKFSTTCTAFWAGSKRHFRSVRLVLDQGLFPSA